jgi:hypothetical protein
MISEQMNNNMPILIPNFTEEECIPSDKDSRSTSFHQTVDIRIKREMETTKGVKRATEKRTTIERTIFNEPNAANRGQGLLSTK